MRATIYGSVLRVKKIKQDVDLKKMMKSSSLGPPKNPLKQLRA